MTLNATALVSRPGARAAAGIVGSALLCGLYARGGAGWVLGFVALVPWLRTLDAAGSLSQALLCGWAVAVAFAAAVFAWFGIAIGDYTQLGSVAGLAVLLVAAPLFQPQFIAFALVRHVARRWHAPVLRTSAAIAAWVATEWLAGKLLGDTLGYGLYPSRLLRQAADIGGATGLTVLLLLANECVAVALAARHHRPANISAVLQPLATAALVPLLLAGYGVVALRAAPVSSAKPLRMGLVQSNIVDYERLRRERGAGAVVREVLDTHFAMSYDAIERQHADAVLWSETVYPTTFGHAKSEAGAALDREILDTVNAAGVPFVFGTYDRDAAGEYNAAAFVMPGTGLLGFYRKTRVFPLTEYVPPWLDGPWLRRWLPWAGHWMPGNGARVFPLRLADGREVPVLPLICLDDTDARLAIDGARLGAQAILTLSNDSWFTNHPQGAALHQAAAAFRSIETRLPQFRVTTNGYSAVIDATGSVIAGTRMDERMLVIGDVPVREPARTLVVRWGDWVGRAAAAWLALLAVAAAWHRLGSRESDAAPGLARPLALPARVAVLPMSARMVAGALRLVARSSLLWMIAAVLLGDGSLRTNTLAQIRSFATLFLAPELAAWCVMRAFAAQASIEDGALVLRQGARRLALPLLEIAAADAWLLPLPGPGLSLRLGGGEHWRYGLACRDPFGLAHSLGARGSLAPQEGIAARLGSYVQARLAAQRGRGIQPWMKFVVFPFALALPAFRLHQHIAYGSAFGEYYTFGLKAYLTTFALWWAAWAIGVVLCAAALRAAIETGSLMAVALRPRQALSARLWLERFGLAALYVGLPAWLLSRFLAS